MFARSFKVPTLAYRAVSRTFPHFDKTGVRHLSQYAREAHTSQRAAWLVWSAITASVAGYSVYNLSNGSNIQNDSGKEVIESIRPVKLIPVSEFVRHNKRTDCWVVIDGEVYDMTDFVPNHPGGQKVIIQNAGYDASQIFDPIHPKGTIQKYLPADKHLGHLDGTAPQRPRVYNPDEEKRMDLLDRLPPISSIQNVNDFEYLAKNILPMGAWAYYSCGSDDEISMRENHYAYQRIFFRPRVCVDVGDIDTSTELLGSKTSVPFYVTATALAKLGNPGGECSIARGAGKEGVIQMISTLSSNSLEEIAEARPKGATQWFQLYVNEDRDMMRSLIRKAEKLGMKAIFVTVDAPSLGNREKDQRSKSSTDTSIDLGSEIDTQSGASKALSSFIDCHLNWNDVKDIIHFTKLPVLIKGVQRVEDVVKAADCGCSGVVLSNHGGRQLDTAPPPVEVLAETVPILNKMEKLKPGFEIFVDGGVKRGTDILKAVALGDNKVRVGVGIGRPFLYANSTYGEKGVRKAIRLLKDEITIDMRLLGVTKIDQLNRNFIDTRRLFAGREAEDFLYHNNYQRLTPVSFLRSRHQGHPRNN